MPRNRVCTALLRTSSSYLRNAFAKENKFLVYKLSPRMIFEGFGRFCNGFVIILLQSRCSAACQYYPPQGCKAHQSCINDEYCVDCPAHCFGVKFNFEKKPKLFWSSICTILNSKIMSIFTSEKCLKVDEPFCEIVEINTTPKSIQPMKSKTK